jgi:hypothetical protein
MFTNRCKTEDHLIDPDATEQDSAQALLAAAPVRPVAADTITRWVDAIEGAEVRATENRTLSFQRLAVHLRALLLDEMKAADALRAELAKLKGGE